MSDKRRVEAEFEGASTCIDGFQFAALPDAPQILVSEPMPADKAERLCTIPGFRACDRPADVLKAVDEQIAIQRAAYRAAAGDGSSATQEIEELRRANHNQAADIDRLRDENAALAQRIGSGNLAQISAERVELGQQVTRLEQEIATLRAQRGDGEAVARLTDERDRATAEVARLTQERDQAGAEVARLTDENAQLRKANEDLAAEKTKGGKGK